MIILSLDPGFVATGILVYSVEKDEIIYLETVETQKSNKKNKLRVADDDYRRLQEIACKIEQIAKKYAPDLVIFEIPHGGARNGRAARAMGLVTGLMAGTMATLNLPTEIYSPADCKKATTGKLNASKSEVERAVLNRFPNTPWPKVKKRREHVIDAGSVLMVALKTSPIVKYGMSLVPKKTWETLM